MQTSVLSLLAEDRRLLVLIDPEMGHITQQARGRVLESTLLERGWLVQFVNVREFPESAIVEHAKQFSFVYLLKIASLSLIRLIKERSKAKVIFDLTDALWMPFHQQHGWQELNEILGLADHITSDNEFIAKYGEKYQAVSVVPTATNVERFELLRSSITLNTTDSITLGWVGSAGTVGGLFYLQDILEELFLKYPQLHLRIVGCGSDKSLPEFKNVRFSTLPSYNEEAMIKEVLGFDIGLFPPPADEEDYIMRGALKAFIYMSGGVPVVCENTGECETQFQHAYNAMLCSSKEEWFSAIEVLINEQELRKSIGERGLALVKRTHSLEHVVRALEAAFVRSLGARSSSSAKTSQ